MPAPKDASDQSLRTDLWYVLCSPMLEVASKTLTTLAVVAAALLLGDRIGVNLVDGFGPLAKQPGWLIVVEMMVLNDLIYYWIHRFAHTYSWLWKFHAVHHSTKHLRWTAALRAHPAELYSHVVMLLPLFLVGFPLDAMAPIAPITALYACIIHSNMNLSAGPFALLLNSPHYHKWHHSLEYRGVGVNFAGYFPFLDRMFGTYHHPVEAPVATGIDDHEMPETFVAQLVYPFRRPSAPGATSDTQSLPSVSGHAAG